MMTPMQRSLAHLRRAGALAAIVERYNAFVQRKDGGKGVRMDLFGFADILAVEPGRMGVLAIQVCRGGESGGDAAMHLEKIRSPKTWPKVRRWLEGDNRLELWSWGVRGAKDERKRWTLKVEPVRLEEDDGATRSG